MALTDDTFATIVNTVREGRRTVHDKLRKAILFITPSNAGEALVIPGAVILAIGLFGRHIARGATIGHARTVTVNALVASSVLWLVGL